MLLMVLFTQGDRLNYNNMTLKTLASVYIVTDQNFIIDSSNLLLILSNLSVYIYMIMECMKIISVEKKK